MGSKGTSTNTSQNQNQSQTYTPNPQAAGYITGALDKAQSAASQPFAVPQAPVAGFSPDQMQAFQQYRDAQGTARPYYNQAANYFSPQGAQDFMNPYAANVMAGMKDIFGAQQSQLNGNLVQAAGGVGADRIGVGQAELGRQQSLAAGQTLSDLYGRSVQQAQSAGQGQMALGQNAQNSAFQSANALIGTGGLQQQLQQAQMNSPYQQQLAQASFPYQQAQFLSGITGALAPGLGGTTQGNSNSAGTSTPPAPSIWSQILGGGTAAAGLYGATGGFGSKGSDPSYGMGNGVYGGSSQNPLPGLDASDYGNGFARGGATHPYYFDDGGKVIPMGDDVVAAALAAIRQAARPPISQSGEVVPFRRKDGGGSVSDDPIDISEHSTIPTVEQQGIRPNIPQLNFSQPKQESGSSSGKGGGVSDILGSVAKIAPLFLLNRGGTVNAYAGGGAAGGDVINPDEPYRLSGPEAIDAWRNDTPMPAMAFTGDDPEPVFPARARRTGVSAAAVAPETAEDVNLTSQTAAAPQGAGSTRDTGFVGNPWTALMAAGLGAMAGTSPYAGVNIGQGGMQGLKALEAQRAAAQKDETIDQAARRLDLEAKHHEDQYSRMTAAQKATLEQQHLPYEQLTAAQKSTQDLNERKQKLEELKPVQVGQDDYGRPIMAKRNPQTGEYEIIRQTPPTGGQPGDPATTPPDAALPPNAAPTQGLLPNGTFGEITSPAGTNPEALEGMKPSDANKVRAIAEGRAKFLPLTRNNAFNRYIMDKVSEYDPQVDETAFSRRQRTANFFAVGTQGGGGQNIAAMNTFGQHAERLLNLSEKLNLGQYPTWNAVKNALAKEGFGQKEIQDMLGAWDLDQKAVADEGAKVFAGTNSALADREEWLRRFDASNPRSVTRAKLKEAVELIEGRLNSLSNQYNEGMRTSHGNGDFIAPKTRAIFDRLKAGKNADATTAPEKPAVESPVTRPIAVTSPAEAQKLAPGTHYVTPDGKEFTR